MKRLTIRLADDLHRRLRFMSLDTGEPLQQLAVRGLEDALRRYEHKKGGRKR